MTDRYELPSLLGLSAALSASMRSGLLAALANGPNTADGYASSASLDPRATRVVLDVLAAFDIASRDGDRYAPTKRLSELATSTPLGLGQMGALWSHAPEFLSTGEPFFKMDAAPGEREALYVNVVPALGRMFAPAARELASSLDRTPPPRRVLDIGCGSGVWSLALAEQFAGAQITGLDLPDVLSAFEARAKELGLSERVDKIPGDMHAVAIPSGAFDIVMIANVLRLEEPERAAQLVKRAAAGVAPGGELIVVDAFSDGSTEGERGLAVYALHLSMRTANGRVYSRSTVKGWMEAAGLREARDVVLSPAVGPVGGVRARAQPV